jgi:TolB-like protein
MNENEVRIGPFRLDLARKELRHDGKTIRLGSRAAEILCVLASAKGELVTKEQLLNQVWRNIVVEENALQVHMSALRKALDEDRSGLTYIVTVPGRGYRLFLQPPQGSSPAKKEDGRSIVVLPFLNMSSDPEQEYFADGVVEDIIAGLSRIKWLSVIARNSSFAYKGKPVDVKQVAHELNVRYVLEGGIRKANDQIRITAQLIDAETGIHLWAERYDRRLDDIFAVQDEITMSVVGAIEPTIRKAEIDRIRRKRPENLDAYDLMLRALPFVCHMMAEGAAQAIPLLKRAIELEPDYAGAHAPLAWCYHFRFSRGGLHEEDRTAALRHARAAAAASTDDASALAIAGLVIWFDEHDTEKAMELFDRALALSNSNVFALCCSSVALAWMGKSQIAIDRAQRALRLSPFDSLNYLAYNALAISFFHTHRFEEARNAARHSVDVNPYFSVPHALLAAALVRLGLTKEAKSEAQKVLALDPTFTIARFAVTAGLVPAVYDEFGEAWQTAGLPKQ